MTIEVRQLLIRSQVGVRAPSHGGPAPSAAEFARELERELLRARAQILAECKAECRTLVREQLAAARER